MLSVFCDPDNESLNVWLNQDSLAREATRHAALLAILSSTPFALILKVAFQSKAAQRRAVRTCHLPPDLPPAISLYYFKLAGNAYGWSDRWQTLKRRTQSDLCRRYLLIDYRCVSRVIVLPQRRRPLQRVSDTRGGSVSDLGGIVLKTRSE